MRRILTSEQMREADRLTIEAGIPGLILMEAAASAVVERLLVLAEPGDQVVILAGKGNNGGDGLAVARQLEIRRSGLAVTVILAADPGELRGDARSNLAMLRKVNVQPRIVRDEAEWAEAKVVLAQADIVVDALLGTGLSGPARGLAATVIADVNALDHNVRVLSVDLPSGLPSDSAATTAETIRADETVTFTAPKPAQVLLPAADFCGRLTVASIGTTDELIESLDGDRLYLTQVDDVAGFVAPREPEAHKGTYGHVAVVGGSASTPGAALMTGSAVLRAGAGLATVFTSRSAAPFVVTARPELMTVPTEELPDGSMGPESVAPAALANRDVLVVGPGLGASPENTALVERLLREVDVPTVVDADGLRAFSQDSQPSSNKALILTPHPGEMARIAGISAAEVQADRIGMARTWAQRLEAVLVLKGARTLIAHPDGRIIVNPTGTPGMATAGSGDVLAGMIAGLLAQFPDEPPEQVAAAAVYLHGLAGERAARKLGEQAMLATDILESLPEALSKIHDESDI